MECHIERNFQELLVVILILFVYKHINCISYTNYNVLPSVITDSLLCALDVHVPDLDAVEGEN